MSDEVVTAGHCVEGAEVRVVEWGGLQWEAGVVTLRDGDVALIEVRGIGASVGAVRVGRLRGGVLAVSAWQGETRARRGVWSCTTETWSVERSRLMMPCGFSNGASGAGVMLGGELVAVVTSKQAGGVNTATLLADS